ncbi:MAG TPA: diacylglycerol kinase family protein [Thermomicrobiales bacterium]|nr:diacylglycerol kinase family protein [Thermomicrobiales bacterium]
MIGNPGAGAPGAMHVLPEVEAFARRYADRVRVATPAPGERLETLAATIADEVDQIIVVGGDGTLNGVVNGVLASARPDVTLALLPAGRGKDSARSLPSLTRADLERVPAEWTCRQIDAGRVTTPTGEPRHFINIASLGLGATSARIAARLPRLPGTTCYLLGAAAGLVGDPAVDVHLRFDDAPDVSLNGCRLIAVANGRYFGGGLHIAPMAAADDGLLDVVTVAGASRAEILRNLPRVFTGAHMTHPAVRHWRTTHLTIEADPGIGVETDGEVLDGTPARFEVVPRAIRWAVPA